MASILDVAREANVSAATVSRVLNGSYSVTQEKRDRVMAAVKKVGYVAPDRLHPTGKDGATGEDGAPNGGKRLLLTICSDYISPILHAFQATAVAKGYRVSVVHYESPSEFGNLSGLIESVSSILAGILLLNCADNSPQLQALVSPYPLVQIGEPILQNQPNRVVYTDEIKMAEDATEYMLNQGRKRIGLLTPAPVSNVVLFQRKQRLKGYYLALMEHGVTPDESLVAFADVSIDGGYEGAKKLLAAHPDLDAIIGSTDVMAQGAIYAIRRAGKTTENVAIFSMDNNEMWDFTHSDFPFIDPHHEEMGSTAAHVLHAAITGALERDYRVVISHTLNCADRFTER